jgi:hypothetical protein
VQRVKIKIEILPTLFFSSRLTTSALAARIVLEHVVTPQGRPAKMKHTETTDARFLKHSAAAKLHDVHPRTIDRWAAQGIIPAPRRVNGLKYYDVAALAAAGVKRG